MFKLITISLIAAPMLVEAKLYGYATMAFMTFLIALAAQIGDDICEAINRRK